MLGREVRMKYSADMNDGGSFFFFQAEDGIRDRDVTGVQTCALPISLMPYGMGTGGSRVMVNAGNAVARTAAERSEERRVGKECRSGWWGNCQSEKKAPVEQTGS